MKELSIEQKAQRYDEAIKKAKELLKTIGNATLGNLVLKNEFKNMFPALEEDEDEEIREWIKKELVSKHVVDNIVNDVMADKALAWIEKRVELKKVEPKFKVGDWCIDNEDGTIFQIVKVLDNTYTYKTNEGKKYSCTHYSLENDARLWTIQDAKDGDVLIDKSNGRECAFIFKETKPSDIKTDCLNPLTVLGYCGIGGAGFTKESGWGDTANCIYYPVTKEQRDVLMKAIAEAGYIFDFEKKELKRNENKIEIPFGARDSELQEAVYYIPKGFHAEIDDDKVVIKKGEKPVWSEEDEEIAKALNDYVKNLDILFSKINIGGKDVLSKEFREKVQHWLKSIKDRVQPKVEWSEEDERLFQIVIDILDRENHSGNISRTDLIACVRKLKSIKDRHTWKPSEGQLECLGYAIEKAEKDWSPLINNRIYLTLKALKEQLEKL